MPAHFGTIFLITRDFPLPGKSKRRAVLKASARNYNSDVKTIDIQTFISNSVHRIGMCISISVILWLKTIELPPPREGNSMVKTAVLQRRNRSL